MDKLRELYESMVAEEKEKMVTDNPTIIDLMEQRIKTLEESVEILKKTING